MRQVYKIDSDGFYIEPVLLKPNEEIPSDCVEKFPTEGLFKHKWNGEAWEEGLTKEEIDKLKNQPAQPTDIDLLKNSDTFILMELMNTQTALVQEQKANADLMLELVTKGVI